MSKIEYITSTEALEIIKRSWLAESGGYKPNLTTLIGWVKKYNLGFKFAGKYRIDKVKLIGFLKQGESK